MSNVNWKNAFNRAVIGFSMLTSLSSSVGPFIDSLPADSIDIGALVPSGKVCVLPDHIRNPKTRIHRYASELYRAAAGLEGDLSTVCFDRRLDKEDACGIYAVGSMNSEINVLFLNPADRIGHTRRAANMRHELRHKEQNNIISMLSIHDRNIPEWQRVTMELVKEADARVSDVVFAHRMGQEGHPEYVENVQANEPKNIMLKAYRQSLDARPEDVQAAMRASFLAFMKGDQIRRSYENNEITWIEENKMYFDPDREAFDLLHDEILDKLGQMEGYNYMQDEEFKAIIRTKLFTGDDYRSLIELRKQSGGAQGAACGNSAPSPDAG